jgi:NTE family protein
MGESAHHNYWARLKKSLLPGKLKPKGAARPKVGLALGGGGARGLAHIGVLKILEEAGIPIDIITGASMGGVIAAAYAVGKSPAEIEAVAMRYTHPMQLMRLLDPSPFQRGFLQGKRVRELLETIIAPQVTFAQTRLPVAFTAVDLPRGELVILREGNLIEAVMATTAVPGLWPPVELDGRQLADGGLLNNVPVDLARQLGADLVIAVRVAPRFPRPDPVLLDVPFLPNFGDHFYQSVLILSDALTNHQMEEMRPDVILNPEMPDSIWLLGFDQAPQAIAAGKTAAIASLEQIRQITQPPQ